MRRLPALTACGVVVLGLLGASNVTLAQRPPAPPPTAKPAQPAPRRPSASGPRQRAVGVRGFATVGAITFSATDTFEAVVGSSSGVVFGGGAQVLLPWGVYAEAAVSRYHRTGERVIIGPGNEVFPLGIPLDLSITPIEVTGGWRHRFTRATAPRARTRRPTPFTAYGGAGLSSYGYRETADFAGAGDDVSERFTGFHVLGGLEYAALRWVSVGAEVGWSSVADALGEAGVSAAFGEDNLGGTTVRLKVSVGR